MWHKLAQNAKNMGTYEIYNKLVHLNKKIGKRELIAWQKS